MGLLALALGVVAVTAITEARARALFDNEPPQGRREWRRVWLSPETWQYGDGTTVLAEVSEIDNGWRWTAGETRGVAREFDEAREDALEELKR